MKRVVQDLPGLAREREALLQLQREPLVHREHVPGAHRMAWHLGAKTRVSCIGVLLWDYASVHRKASLMDWVRAAHPECHMLFVPFGYTAELQPADISIQQPLKHSIKEQAMQFFAEYLCRNEAVLDLRLSTMKRLTAHRALHACAEVEKHEHHNESLAPHLLDIRRGTKACGESRSRAPQRHSPMRRRWNKKSHQKKRTSFSMMTTTMTMLRIPRARAQLLRRQSCRPPRWLPKSRAQNAACICAARTARIHRNLSATCLHADAGPNVCSHRAVVAHESGLSPTATILLVVGNFQMYCGRAIGHGLCHAQRHGVPHSSHRRALLSWCSVLARQMGLSLRGNAQSGRQVGLSLRGFAQEAQ